MSILNDQKRFNDIIRGRIKKNFEDYITHGEMIGKRGKEFVKIPVPTIEIPKFKYGKKEQGGVGQGQGKPGDCVEGAKSKEPGQGEAGDGEGKHLLEVDVTLEDLADILGEALELPKIKPKGSSNIDSQKNKYSGRNPVGSDSLRVFKSSYKEALKRSIASGTYDPQDPYVIPIKRDMRYLTQKKVMKPHTKAVVIYMMDVSGSMGEEQKDIVRLESFWINTWLSRNYKGLETRFIIHDAAAKEVDEDTFFATSESGGTLISSAYKYCKKIIEEDYPINDWNIYPFHFSDGDNWSGDDTRFCINLLNDFFLPKVNMFGYGQVESKYGSGQFYRDLEKHMPGDDRIILSRIESKDKIVGSIKDFLGKGK